MLVGVLCVTSMLVMVFAMSQMFMIMLGMTTM